MLNKFLTKLDNTPGEYLIGYGLLLAVTIILTTFAINGFLAEWWTGFTAPWANF